MGKVRPRTYANLQHGPPCLAQHLSPAIPDWCRVAHSVHESWINVVSVEPHAAINSTPSRVDDSCCGSPITLIWHDESVNSDAAVEVVEETRLPTPTQSDL